MHWKVLGTGTLADGRRCLTEPRKEQGLHHEVSPDGYPTMQQHGENRIVTV